MNDELEQLKENKKNAVAPEEKKPLFKAIGNFKLKDFPKEKSLIAFQIQPDMKAVVIQKVRGSSRIVVAVEVSSPKVENKVIKKKEIKNEKKLNA